MVIQRTPVIKVRMSINAEKRPYESFFFLRTFFVRINRKRLIVRTTVKRNKSREKIKVTIPERKSLMSWSRIPRFEKKRTSLTSFVLRITKVIKVPPSTSATKNIAPKNANIFESGVFCAFLLLQKVLVLASSKFFLHYYSEQFLLKWCILCH